MRRIVAVATVAAARAQLDAAGHAAAAPARRDPIDTTPGLRGGAAPAAASEEEDYSACTTVAAELAFARLEIAALQHDNAVLASENRVLANARNLPEVVADVREYIRHVVDGDDAGDGDCEGAEGDPEGDAARVDGPLLPEAAVGGERSRE